MPSINDGLFSGRAGIQSHGSAISVVADNIANANTVGFKPSRADFADVLAGSLNGAGGAVIGSGSQILATTPIMNQGTLEFTGRGLDVGIAGNGFFVTDDPTGSGQRFYSRAGNLAVDTDGYLINQNGYRVMGFASTGGGGLTALNVNERSTGTIDTKAVEVGVNLNAASPLGAPPGGAPTFAQLSDAAEFSTFVDVYDSLGAAHTVTLFYFHTAANTWEVGGYVDAGEVGGVAGQPSLIGSAPLAFDPTGNRTAPVPAVDFTATPAWSNGSAALPMTFSIVPATQFASPSAVTAVNQDGTGAGKVVGFAVEQDGTLFATLDNGRTASIGVIALATFSSPEGLRRQGSSLYVESISSGAPVVGRPNSGLLGSLEAGSLELSSADLASDFVKLISYQRGYQGSSRIIGTIDDLLNEIVNLA